MWFLKKRKKQVVEEPELIKKLETNTKTIKKLEQTFIKKRKWVPNLLRGKKVKKSKTKVMSIIKGEISEIEFSLIKKKNFLVNELEKELIDLGCSSSLW